MFIVSQSAQKYHPKANSSTSRVHLIKVNGINVGGGLMFRRQLYGTNCAEVRLQHLQHYGDFSDVHWSVSLDCYIYKSMESTLNQNCREVWGPSESNLKKV